MDKIVRRRPSNETCGDVRRCCVELRTSWTERRARLALPREERAMSTEVLQRRFNEVGAHLQVPDTPWHGAPRLDVLGSTFDVRFGRGRESVELEVVDVKPRDRHLLLLARVDGVKSKFLCGHD